MPIAAKVPLNASGASSMSNRPYVQRNLAARYIGYW